MAPDWKVCLQLLTALCCFLLKNELSAATHLTSRLLKEYDKQVGQVISHLLTLAKSPVLLAISCMTVPISHYNDL